MDTGFQWEAPYYVAVVRCILCDVPTCVCYALCVEDNVMLSDVALDLKTLDL